MIEYIFSTHAHFSWLISLGLIILICTLCAIEILGHSFYTPGLHNTRPFRLKREIVHRLPIIPIEYKQEAKFILTLTGKLLYTIIFLLFCYNYTALVHRSFLITAFVISPYIGSVVASYNNMFVIKNAVYLSAFGILLVYPILVILLFLHKLVQKTRNVKLHNMINNICALVEYSEQEGLISKTDRIWVESILTMSKMNVTECMIPKQGMHLWRADMTVSKALKTASNVRYNNIPVYAYHKDNIIGVLHYRDLAQFALTSAAKKTRLTELKHLMTPPYFIPETKTIYSLFQELKNNTYKLAIIVNEYGLIEGLITISDIVELIVGNIHFNKHDNNEHNYSEHPDKGWLVASHISLNELYLQLGIAFPRNAEYDRLGGFILYHTETIPKPGDIISLNGYNIKIISVTDTSILSVHIYPDPSQQ